MNDRDLICEVYSRVPVESVPLVVKMLPNQLLGAMLNFIRTCIDLSDRGEILARTTESSSVGRESGGFQDQVKAALEVHLTWLMNLLWIHSKAIQCGGQSLPKSLRKEAKDTNTGYVAELRTLLLLILKNLRAKKSAMNDLFTENDHLTQYMSELL
eukprot:Protomagalhaensia_wolfi_Nauph_80__1537@NODE_1939_length_1271_cov_43_117695_g1517_i0_p1_GENE_NODE_1939_length_1271_cov_43_117695_g1517_i0NODE_1939_length_1271_cov_43_117695_g1517_i0_p1_ORF_typecomplete_len156_score27_65Utp12/PF04003_12/1_6e12DUF2205/PF10224_9/0_055_NODE_1939_length_1271_cov_43_117695_g1517_i0485952